MHLKVIEDVFDGRSRIEGRATAMRPKVISNRITKDTPTVEENKNAGRQASQPRHNGAICSFTKAADEEGQKSQLVKESIVK